MSSFRRPRKSSNNTLRSSCNDIIVKGTWAQIAAKWDELSAQAFAEGNRILGELYRQQAEHYHKSLDFSGESV